MKKCRLLHQSPSTPFSTRSKMFNYDCVRRCGQQKMDNQRRTNFAECITNNAYVSEIVRTADSNQCIHREECALYGQGKRHYTQYIQIVETNRPSDQRAWNGDFIENYKHVTRRANTGNYHFSQSRTKYIYR